MLMERIEQRVLGALLLVDRVTQTPITRAMELSCDSARVMRNLRGMYVVTHADGLEQHTEAFMEPPNTPVIEANQYIFEINDPQKRYLPRQMIMRLPRDPNPDNMENDNSLFTPRDVEMYPAATASLSPNWSSVRVSVTQGPDPQTAPPVRGSLMRIVDPEDDTVLASGISDERGEALVIVPGVPVTKFADDEDGPGGGGGGGHGHDDEPPVLVNTLPVRLELSLDAAAPWPVNPEVLEQNHAANLQMSMELTLSTGRMERAIINLT